MTISKLKINANPSRSYIRQRTWNWLILCLHIDNYFSTVPRLKSNCCTSLIAAWSKHIGPYQSHFNNSVSVNSSAIGSSANQGQQIFCTQFWWYRIRSSDKLYCICHTYIGPNESRVLFCELETLREGQWWSKRMCSQRQAIILYMRHIEKLKITSNKTKLVLSCNVMYAAK